LNVSSLLMINSSSRWLPDSHDNKWDVENDQYIYHKEKTIYHKLSAMCSLHVNP